MLNIRANPLASPEAITFLHDKSTTITSKADLNNNKLSSSSKFSAPTISASFLVGMNFLMNEEDGQYLRDRIVEALDDFKGDLTQDSIHLKILFSMKDDSIEGMFTYNELLDHISNSEEDGLAE